MNRQKIIRLSAAALILLSSINILSGCGKRRSADPADRVLSEPPTVTEQDKAPESSAAEPAQAGETGTTARGFQLTDSYGICAPGSPVIYQMAHKDVSGADVRLEAENSMAKIRLLDAVFQNGKLIVRYEITDYSVEVLSEAETEELRRKERENREKEEKGEKAEWDFSYIRLDEEKGIYGRSAFESGILKDATNKLYTADARIYGQGIATGGRRFSTGGNNRSYEEFFEKGTMTIQCVKYSDTIGFTEDKPEGLYKLMVEGFDQPLVFEFEKAPEYASLEDVEGMVHENGWYILALGAETEDGLMVSVSSYSPDGSRLSFGRTGLRYREEVKGDSKEAGEWEIIEPGKRQHIVSVNNKLEGLMEGYSTQYLYRIPDDTLQEGGKLKEAEIFTGEVYVTTNEISDVITVGIPETGESAPEKVEFRDSVLTLTGKRIKDREAGTDESGEKIMKPALRIDISAGSKNPDVGFYYIRGFKGEADLEPDIPPFSDKALEPVSNDSGDGIRLSGFIIPYEEGEKEVKLRLANPSYQRTKKLAIPVKMQ